LKKYRPVLPEMMLFLGSLLAVVSGMLYVAATLLQKRKGMQVLHTHAGFKLMAVLARRPAWLLSVVISVVAWVAEAASLALAPVATVTTLRNSGRGLLVIGGRRWLDERFSRWEVAGVALSAAGGALTAVAGVYSTKGHLVLSNVAQLAIGAGCALTATAILWAGSSFEHLRPRANPHEGRRTTGVLYGVAVGVVFVGTGVFTKEIADRVALYGAGGPRLVLASPSLWMLLLMGIWEQNLLQEGFRRANAATVSSASSATASVGLICAGVILYAERPGNGALRLLEVGTMMSLLGTSMLFGPPPARQDLAGEVTDGIATATEFSS
jgi:drug/metabolite transporter (DMT)-like permease